MRRRGVARHGRSPRAVRSGGYVGLEPAQAMHRFGPAHDSVTDLYAIMRNGERVDWPIHHDPRNQERYFACRKPYCAAGSSPASRPAKDSSSYSAARLASRRVRHGYSVIP
jgi:hypothetical protein